MSAVDDGHTNRRDRRGHEATAIYEALYPNLSGSLAPPDWQNVLRRA